MKLVTASFVVVDPTNSQESQVNRVLLPFCPRLRRLILQRSKAVGVHIVDTRNCFYLYQVDSSRWHTQVIGPRIPASWLHHIVDDTCDEINDTNMESWWELDLRQSSDNDEPHDGYRQIAIVGVMMGDTNAVSVLEMAHRRQLINAGVLRTDSLLLPERPLPHGDEFGDVLFSTLHFSRLNELAHCPRAALVHATCTDSCPCRLRSPKELLLSALSSGTDCTGDGIEMCRGVRRVGRSRLRRTRKPFCQCVGEAELRDRRDVPGRVISQTRW